MIEARFGATLDYHGGGTDLRFPHHQAEIQQSEAAYDRPLANRWVHHGSVHDAHGKKMSKSLGNYVELEDSLAEAEALLPGAGGAVLRLALLSTLWTKPLDWTGSSLLAQSAASLQLWAQAAGNAQPNPQGGQALREALFQNLNTPAAFARLHSLAKQALNGQAEAAGAVAYGMGALGIPEHVYRRLPRLSTESDVPAHVTALIADRAEFRKSKQWEQADGVRLQLEALGYVVEDSPVGPKARKLKR